VAKHVVDGLKLLVDRGPNWLFIKLRQDGNQPMQATGFADKLWAIASRHFIYRVVLELEELQALRPKFVEELVALQDRLAQCGGALRICGLSRDCAELLTKRHLDVALPNYATRQDAVLGGEATAFRERLKAVASHATDETNEDSSYALWQACLQ
jgi:anti-sigma B factor antagonist